MRIIVSIAQRWVVGMVLTMPLLAAAQGPNLDATLEKTGKQMSAYLGQVSDVKCSEHVLQQKLGKGNHVELAENSDDDYLILLQSQGDEFMLNESRLASKDAKPQTNLPLLVTNGFSTLFLIFHPYYQSSFLFTGDGAESLDSIPLVRVRFTHIPGKRTPAALSLRGREYPLDLTGTAWIEPETGRVARIVATVQTDMTEIGLRSLTTEVDYTPVRLPGWKDAYRFPTVATIDVQSLRQHWRNTHTFRNYMRFSVEAEQAPTAQVKQP